MKDYLEANGYTNIIGSRGAMRQAFAVGLIVEERGWSEMVSHRNLTVHTYNEDTANEITDAIRQTYFQLFKTLEVRIIGFL